MTDAVLLVLGLLTVPAVDAVQARARQVRAYLGGYQCLTHRRCSSSHTYRLGCLLRSPGSGRR